MQDAYAVALDRWPRDGVPATPAAWILTTAKRRAIDRLRREASLRDKQALLARELEEAVRDLPGEDEAMIPDERLGLVFACCHPALALEAQVAADAAAGRRPHRARDRPRAAAPRADRGAADGAREAQDPRVGHPARRARRPTRCRTGSPPCSPCST